MFLCFQGSPRDQDENEGRGGRRDDRRDDRGGRGGRDHDRR